MKTANTPRHTSPTSEYTAEEVAFFAEGEELDRRNRAVEETPLHRDRDAYYADTPEDWRIKSWKQVLKED